MGVCLAGHSYQDEWYQFRVKHTAHVREPDSETTSTTRLQHKHMSMLRELEALTLGQRVDG